MLEDKTVMDHPELPRPKGPLPPTPTQAQHKAMPQLVTPTPGQHKAMHQLVTHTQVHLRPVPDLTQAQLNLVPQL